MTTPTDLGVHDEGFALLTRHEALTVAAAAARLFPSDDLGPGAPEAGVVYYIDRALAGHDAPLAESYRRGAALLDRLARAASNLPFWRAPVEVQDAILTALESGTAVGPEAGPARAAADAGDDAPAASFGRLFFGALLQHTREGLFADPVHGGNRAMVGWRLLGHPGVHMEYGPADYVPGARVAREPRGLAEFLAERGR